MEFCASMRGWTVVTKSSGSIKSNSIGRLHFSLGPVGFPANPPGATGDPGRALTPVGTTTWILLLCPHRGVGTLFCFLVSGRLLHGVRTRVVATALHWGRVEGAVFVAGFQFHA